MAVNFILLKWLNLKDINLNNMKIYLDTRHYGLIFTLESNGTTFQEDVETRKYKLDKEGKISLNSPVIRDIDVDFTNQIVRLLEDIMYYKSNEYDSSDLITALFENLPSEVAEKLSEDLYSIYKSDKE